MRWLRGLVTGTPSRDASGYERIADIAGGGIGWVELVVRREGSFERLYARKRLRIEHRSDPDVVAMFSDEARIAGLVRHPNVVSVLDVGSDDGGPFLVMEYVEGVPASAIVRHAKETGSPVALQLALRIAMEAALGLHAAHELTSASGEPLALVHRDVSPQNLLVGFDGVTRVTDFGIAKAFGQSTRTQTGMLKGKLGYVAPEQLRFEEVDRRTDLFTLGVVLYELLAGERLYRNVDGHDGLRRILHEPPPDLGEVRADAPPELVELVFSMLAKDPAQRPATALAVVRVLESVLDEVIATEGRLDVAEHLRTSFAAEVARARAQARERPRAGGWPRPPRSAAIAAGVAAGLIAGAVAWASVASNPFAEGDDAPRPTPPSAAPPPPSAPIETASAPVEPVEDPAASAAEAVPEPRPARRGARRGARETGASRAGIPMWDWQQ